MSYKPNNPEAPHSRRGVPAAVESYQSIAEVFLDLSGHFAHEPHWWPILSDTPAVEVLIGAILVQQTRWETVEAAIRRLLELNWMSPEALVAASPEHLAQLIRPCAFHSQKAAGLQQICRIVLTDYAGQVSQLLSGERWQVRAKLLALPRIGRETADTIMLYAGKHPGFIVDAYARRLIDRLGLYPNINCLRASYDQVQAIVEQDLSTHYHQFVPQHAIPSTLWLYRELHALLTEACIHHCTASNPRCHQPGLQRRPFLDPRKCAEHCLVCRHCPLQPRCHTAS